MNMTKPFAATAYHGGITSLQHLHNVIVATVDNITIVKAGDVNLFGEVYSADDAAASNASQLERLANSLRGWAEYIG